MSLAVRYLCRHFFKKCVVVFFAFLGVASVAVLLDLAQDMSMMSLGPLWLSMMIGVQLPHMVMLILPPASYFAAVIAWGQLQYNQELFVIKISGFSFRRVLSFLAGLGLCLSTVVLLSAPVGSWFFSHLGSHQDAFWMNRMVADWPAQQFIPLSKKQFMYARHKDGESLSDIWWVSRPVFRSDAMPRLAWVQARQAQLNHGQLILSHGYHVQIDPKVNQFILTDFKSYHPHFLIKNPWRPLLPSWSELWKQRHTHLKIRVALYWQIAWVVMPLVLLIWAWCWATMRRSVAVQMLSAVLGYGVYWMLLMIGARVVMWGELWSWPSVLWVHGLVAVVGLLVLNRSAQA